VNDPFTCPNSSDSSKLSGSAPQLSEEQAFGARGQLVEVAGDDFFPGA